MSEFEALGLSPDVIRAVQELGFESPTSIQKEAIPKILSTGKDLIALAQTGTGKTAAFGLPLVEMIDQDFRGIQALILSPTRELAIQIAKDLESYARFSKGLKVLPVYGGSSISDQIRSLKRGVQVVTATPGRAVDLIQRKVLDLSTIKWVVLDEADEMLNMGFTEDLDFILDQTPEERQTLLFSATMAPPVARIAKKYMQEPEEITVGTRNSGAKNVTHGFYMVHARDRYEALRRVISMEPDFYGIVFCRTRRNTEEVASKLIKDGFPAEAINGDLSQSQRDGVMGRFRNQRVRIMVATDVAARGIDVNDLTHVINFELPDDPEVYVHRSGRTGRAGKEGASLSFVHMREGYKIRGLERMVNKPFERLRVPSGEELVRQNLLKWSEHVLNAEIHEEEMADFYPQVETLLADLDREELLKRFISMQFSSLLQGYQGAEDLNASTQRRDRNDSRSDSRRDRNDSRRDRPPFDRGRGPSRDRGDEGGRDAEAFTTFSINLGDMDNVNPARLMGLVNEQLKDRSVRFGKINIRRTHTMFELDQRYESQLLSAFDKLVLKGRSIDVSKAHSDSEKRESKLKRKRKRK